MPFLWDRWRIVLWAIRKFVKNLTRTNSFRIGGDSGVILKATTYGSRIAAFSNSLANDSSGHLSNARINFRFTSGL
jgi:hypothetical protein